MIYQINYIPLHRIYSRFVLSILHIINLFLLSLVLLPNMYLLSPSQQCALLLIPYALTPIPQRRLLPREMNKRLAKWLAERICPKRKSIPTPQPAYSLTVSYIWHFMNNFSLTISLLHFCFVSFYPQSNVKIFTLMLPDVNIEFRSVEMSWMGVNTMFKEFRTKSRSLSDRSHTFRILWIPYTKYWNYCNRYSCLRGRP